MKNKQKINELLARLNALEGDLPFGETERVTDKIISQEMAKIEANLKENATIKSLEKIHSNLIKARKGFDLTPIISGLKELQDIIALEQKTIVSNFEVKLAELKRLATALNTETGQAIDGKIDKLGEALKSSKEQFDSQLQTNQAKEVVLRQEMYILEDKLKKLASEDKPKFYDKEIAELRSDFMSRLTNLGGGSPNQQINVNSSVMSTRYADINFRNAGNIGWTAANDDTNRRVNITASILVGGGGGSALTVQEVDGVPTVSNVSTIVVSNGTLTDDGGGQVTVTTGGGGGGITRTTSVLSVSSTLAAVASTDYVFFPNVGVQLTLPTAINNSDLYTIKNISTSSILVATTAGQTIDDSATALMSAQYESLTFISNNSVWGVV